jgi:hypothetical protein
VVQPVLEDAAPSVLSDGLDSIVMGWVDDRVLVARFSGTITPGLARAHAMRFESMARGATGIAYFADASGLVRYDLLVRSAFARFVLTHPRLFASITLLATNDEVRRNLEPLVDTLGGLVHVTADPSEFERRLLVESPFAFRSPLFQNDARGPASSPRGRAPRSSIRPKHPFRR